MDRSQAIQRGFTSELEKLGFLEALDLGSVGEGIKGVADSAWGGIKSFGTNMLHDTGADAHIHQAPQIPR